jgi:hypothetical protein
MTDDWGTPDWLMRPFNEYYDPCPINCEESEKDDLEGYWFVEKVFVNPPYSNPKPWVEKAIRSNHKYDNTIVMLLRHDSSTQWYRMLKEAGARFLMVEGRLTFKGPNSRPCSFPSVLVVLS